MIDIKFIKENRKTVEEAIKNKNTGVDLGTLINHDKKRKELLQKTEELNHQRKSVGRDEIKKGKKIKKELAQVKKELNVVQKEYTKLLYQVPNIPSGDTPVGANEKDNKVIKKKGKIPKFDFKPRPHWEIGEKLKIIDNSAASKVSGARFTYLKGGLVSLQFAIINFALDVLQDEKKLAKIAQKAGLKVKISPFIPVLPPVMIKPKIFNEMARLEPKDERYYIKSDDLYLVGSAEHTLGPMHKDEIFEEKSLPERYVGYSTCFRREAGTYGRDTRGILRVHQFDKIEIESFVKEEDSIEEQDFIVAIQEYLVQELELPYQVVQICTGDMGMPDSRQIDIEIWMPGQNKYRETHTADLMTDFQARRLNTKYRTNDGTLKFAHMNDATVFALGRILVAIMENYQNSDGSFDIPKILQKYCSLKKIH